MKGWLAVQKDDCFTVHISDTQESAESAADNFAVPYSGDAEKFLSREGKTVVNHSRGGGKRNVTYRETGCFGSVCWGLLIIFTFAMIFTYFVR